MYLKQRGCVVATANSMSKALADLPDFHCEVLLSDLGLKDGNGWDLLTQAKLPEDVFAIAMSGFCSVADRQRSDNVGFRAHLTKPFAAEELDGILEQAAAHRAQSHTTA